MNWLRNLIRRWLGLNQLELRLLDIERHFVTKRDNQGLPVETLADIPLEKRKERKIGLRGMSMQQRIAWAEKTDGGRLV